MPSRFGIKDAVLLVLLLGVGLSVWLKMVQDDRAWRKLAGIESRLAEVQQQLAELRVGGAVGAGGDAGAKGVGPPGRAGPSDAAAPGDRSAGQSAAGSGPPARDESWAIAGIAVQWQPPYTHATDPRSQPGYREGGELTELMESEPGSLTPYFSQGAYGRRAIELVCEGLADYHPVTMKLRGRLAAAWQYDAAGKRLRVRIRDEAHFSDGSPVAASDVAWTFNEIILNPVIENLGARRELAALKRVEALGPKVVEFAFSAQTFALEEQILTQPILPAAVYSQMPAEALSQSSGVLAGSGPYRLVVSGGVGGGAGRVGGAGGLAQWERNTPVELERNERYWGPRSPLDRIRFTWAQDDHARMTAYFKGDADIVFPGSTQAPAIRGREGFDREHLFLSWLGARQGQNGIVWRCGKRADGRASIFDDVRVRRAMTLLLDRELILREFYHGLGEVSAGPFNPRSVMSSPDLKPEAADLEKARALLAEAGWQDRDGDGVIEDADGRRFEFAYSRPAKAESDRQIGAYLVDRCAAAKILCRDNPLGPSEFREAAIQGDFDALRYGSSASVPEPDPTAAWHSQSFRSGRNLGAWSNAAADRLIESGAAEMDRARRHAIWRELEGVIASEHPWTFLRHNPVLRVVRRDIGNVQLYPAGLQLTEFFRLKDGPPPAAATSSVGSGQ